MDIPGPIKKYTYFSTEAETVSDEWFLDGTHTCSGLPWKETVENLI